MEKQNVTDLSKGRNEMPWDIAIAEGYFNLPWYENDVNNTSKKGKNKNKIIPSTKAKNEDHVVFKRNQQGVTNYVVYKYNKRNPSCYDEILRYDGVGAAHWNKETQESIPTPHVHVKSDQKWKARKPTPEENPVAKMINSTLI